MVREARGVTFNITTIYRTTESLELQKIIELHTISQNSVKLHTPFTRTTFTITRTTNRSVFYYKNVMHYTFNKLYCMVGRQKSLLLIINKEKF